MSKPPSQSKISQLPDDFEELDFEIISEYWNTYELSDGVRIKARTMLKKLSVDPNNPDNHTMDLLPIVSSVWAPLAIRGERSNPPQPSEFTSLKSYETELTNSDERFNVYRILKNGNILKLKLVVTKISRVVDRYDKDGLPFYLLNSGPMVVMEKSNFPTNPP